MNLIAALDIEIIQDPKTIPLIPEKAKGERTEPWEKLKFDSNYNMICSWALHDGENTHSRIISECADETTIIDELWYQLTDYEQIITFNGLSFDIPFLIKRSWYCGVKPTKNLNLRRYQAPDRTTNHIDLRCLLSNWDSYAKGSLDLYSKLVLGEDKGGIDGSMVQQMWDEGKFEEIRKYNEHDAILTYRLYDRMKGFYL